MTNKVIQRNIHISHRKASLVIDLVRNKPVHEAIRILSNTPKKFAPIVLKLLNSAISNVQHNSKDMDPSKLYIYKIVANQGPTMKRTLPRAKGSADQLFKRTTHLEIVLSDDVNEREKELAAIKAKKSKKPLAVEPVAKVETKKVAKPSKVEIKPVEKDENVDPELLKREQQVLKVVEKTASQKEEETTETIMISTSPKNAQVLFDDLEKNVIFYKTTPINKVLRVLVYVTSPTKKVVGEFDLESVEIGAISSIWRKYSKQSVISKKEYDAYYEGKDKAHALVSKKAYKYRNPKDLSEYNMTKGPSGFQYLK